MLPDAMEGPTRICIITCCYNVTAGVFLVSFLSIISIFSILLGYVQLLCTYRNIAASCGFSKWYKTYCCFLPVVKSDICFICGLSGFNICHVSSLHMPFSKLLFLCCGACYSRCKWWTDIRRMGGLCFLTSLVLVWLLALFFRWIPFLAGYYSKMLF